MEILYGAIAGGVVSIIVHLITSSRDNRDKRMEQLEERVQKLEVSQRDIIYIKETQDRLALDIKDLILSLSDVRVKLAELLAKERT